jgi:uncharacterized protein YkwD
MSRRFSAISAAVTAGSLLLHVSAQAGVFKSAPCDTPGMQQVIVQQVNSLRARGAVCGGQRYGTAGPVAYNGQLFTAAIEHSRDMAENNYFSHNDRSGGQAEHRVEKVGYRWQSVGENIAAGQDYDARSVVSGWMGSPAHCSNIMDPDYNEIAVACVTRPGTTYGKYWTMVLARR